MKKQIIDCSKSIGHQERVKMVDMTPAEIQAAQASALIVEAKKLEPKPLTLEERVTILEGLIK